MFVFSRIIMQSDCTRFWQVGQTGLSAYFSNPVSLSPNALPATEDGKHPLMPSVTLPIYALSSIWGAYADVCFFIWDPPFYALQTETFLSSIISTGSHYIFLTDFFKLAGLYQCTSEWKLHCERHVSSLVGLIHILHTHTHTHTHQCAFSGLPTLCLNCEQFIRA